MNHLSEFLQSEHAARYVATAKKEGHSTVLMASGDYFLSGIVGRDNKNPSDTKWINPWERIWLSLEIRTDFTRNEVLAKNVSAYFRREVDRYIVSDLGESVRALRLASGLKSGDDINAAQRAAIAEASSYPFSDVRGPTDIEIEATEAHLPSAICRILLASHRVASLAEDARFKQSPSIRA